MLQTVVASATALVADDPKNPEYLEVLSRAHRSLGQRLTICLFKPKHWLESEASLRQALSIDEGLAKDYPQMPLYRANLAATLDALGRVLDATGKPAEVEQIQQRSLEIGQKLAAEYPQVPDYQSALGVMANSRAAVQMGLGKWEEARGLLEQAITHQKAALAIIARHHQHIVFLYAHWIDLIEVQIALGDPAAAERTAEDFAHHLYRPGALQSPFWAIDICEIFLVNMDVIQRPDAPYPQRREPQLAAYRLLIKALVKDTTERSQDDPDQYQIADFLTTAPEPFRDPALALKLARRAVELKPESDLCLQSLGWALYRAGDFKGSIEATKNLSASDANGSFIPAMAHWQLGEKTEARARFNAATERLKGYEQKCQELLKTLQLPVPPPSQLRRLQAEAAALLGMTPATAEPAPEPAAKVEEAKEQPKSTPAPEAAKEEEQPNK
jgi:tetratricopeptide (TPR) repeat protein